jgi:hypothetical protein
MTQALPPHTCAAGHADAALQLTPHAADVPSFASHPVPTSPSVLQYPALQLAIPQTPALHDATPFVTEQGAAALQALPVASHVCTPVPEQRVVPGRHTVHTPAMHAVDAQSPLPPHFLLTAQVAPQLPPQSTSVSVPFLTVSVQAAAAHLLPVHLPLPGNAQSVLATHVALTAHVAPQFPPQSTSVSVPSFTRSPHVAATQVPVAGAHR